MTPCFILNEDVVRKDTDHSLEVLSLPPILSTKEDVINDISPQEIIIETLHHEMILMLGSQPMNPCYVKWCLIRFWGRMMNLK